MFDLRVHMINTRMTGGGAGRAAEHLAAMLRAAGDTVTAFVAPEGRRDPDSRHVGWWRDRTIADRASAAGFPDLGAMSSLAWPAHADFASADVLHLHNLHGDYASLFALPIWARYKPTVWTLHDHWPITGGCATPMACDRWRNACGRCPLVGVYPMGAKDRSRFFRKLKPKLIRMASPILVSPSRWLADRVRSVPELRRLDVRVIPHSVDFETFKPIDDSASVRASLGLAVDVPTVALAGNTWKNPHKGGAQAIVALRRAAATIRDLQVLVIGQDSEAFLQRVGLPGVALDFVDNRAQFAAALACADAFLFPSLAENYPLTTLEAMAAGTPACAFRVGGVPEQIEHGETGMLANAGDAKALGENLVTLLRDEANRKAMAAQARAWVQRHANPETMTAAYRVAYHDSIRAWQRRTGRRSPARPRGMLARWIAQRLGWDERAATPRVRTKPETKVWPALAGGVS